MIKLVKQKWWSLQTRTLLGSHDSWSGGLCPYVHPSKWCILVLGNINLNHWQRMILCWFRTTSQKMSSSLWKVYSTNVFCFLFPDRHMGRESTSVFISKDSVCCGLGHWHTCHVHTVEWLEQLFWTGELVHWLPVEDGANWCQFTKLWGKPSREVSARRWFNTGRSSTQYWTRIRRSCSFCWISLTRGIPLHLCTRTDSLSGLWDIVHYIISRLWMPLYSKL